MSVSGSPDGRGRGAPTGVKGCRRIQIPVPGSPGGREGLPQIAAAGYRFRLGLAYTISGIDRLQIKKDEILGLEPLPVRKIGEKTKEIGRSHHAAQYGGILYVIERWGAEK